MIGKCASTFWTSSLTRFLFYYRWFQGFSLLFFTVFPILESLGKKGSLICEKCLPQKVGKNLTVGKIPIFFEGTGKTS